MCIANLNFTRLARYPPGIWTQNIPNLERLCNLEQIFSRVSWDVRWKKQYKDCAGFFFRRLAAFCHFKVSISSGVGYVNDGDRGDGSIFYNLCSNYVVGLNSFYKWISMIELGGRFVDCLFLVLQGEFQYLPSSHVRGFGNWASGWFGSRRNDMSMTFLLAF